MKNITYYTIGHLGKMEVGFPEDRVCCRNCERAYPDKLNRVTCDMLRRLIFDPEVLHPDCPIEFTGEVRGTVTDKIKVSKGTISAVKPSAYPS